MTLILPKACAMGSSQTGLVGTLGMTLLNPDGTIHTARDTADIYEMGGGCYGKIITFPDAWVGSILWDTGGADPRYATEEYGIEGMLYDDLTFLRDEAGGKWEIVGDQMIFYKEDDSELMRFNLFDESGQPTMINVFKRERV